MTHVGPLNGIPVACTLPTLAAAREQLEKWRAFEADYALFSERTDTQLTVHYTRRDDSIAQLRELVATEKQCCAFVEWSINEGGTDLRLIVRGSAFQLAALNVSG